MIKNTTTPALEALQEALLHRGKAQTRRKITYEIPSTWVAPGETPRRMKVDPFDFFHDTIKRIRKSASPLKRGSSGGEWTRDAVVYNMFVRTTVAFDHDRNGTIDLPTNKDGFRETGTFVKAIALLPYIKYLGANTVHLLPITSIGHDGNKGSLGSPYAIRNPYTLDENLKEPELGLDVNTEFRAFVEAAHCMGMRVVVEFVFRTAAKDADWIMEHPEWFYWIRDEIEERDSGAQDESRYGSPIFTRSELDAIHHQISNHQYDKLLPPHRTYQEFFVPSPPSASVMKMDGRYLATLPDSTRAKIPGAFADWPPDDNQPPWGDVTYLRMYDHQEFNYIAYNTIRMYDSRLAREQHVNRGLWDKIVGVIPFYQREYDIDGVMIDMGHALPMDLKKEMVRTARQNDPDFAFWDENFSINYRSREEGYNAVFGFLWIDQHHPPKMKNFCRRCAHDGFPIPYFGTPENHNTPRAASRSGELAYARWSWVINSFLPAVPFIHSGFDLAETYPINTGLDFTPEQIRQLPSHKLPLFSEYAYDWLNKREFSAFIAMVSRLRKKYHRMVVDPNPIAFELLHESNEHVLAFARVDQENGTRIAIISNMNFTDAEKTEVRLSSKRKSVTDLLGGDRFDVKDGSIVCTLKPGQCLVVET